MQICDQLLSSLVTEECLVLPVYFNQADNQKQAKEFTRGHAHSHDHAYARSVISILLNVAVVPRDWPIGTPHRRAGILRV